MKKLILIIALLGIAFVAKGQESDSLAVVMSDRWVIEPIDTFIQSDTMIYLVADTMPTINGYSAAVFQRWVEKTANEIVVEEEYGTFGRTIVLGFVIGKNGEAFNFEILNENADEYLAKIAVGVIKMGGTWKAGVIGGEAVRVKQTMPIKFAANEGVLIDPRDELPEFQGGGLEKFRAWTQAGVDYPRESLENGEQGVVVLTFIVEKDGSLSNIEVIKSPSRELSKAAIDRVKKAPRWEPAMRNGKPVRLKYTLPIAFRIAE